MLDQNGQPIRPFPAALISNHGKAVDQIIGFASGILCDGIVSEAEADAFRRIVDRLHSAEPIFPFDQLKLRLDRIFQDGKVDDDEKEELRAVLQSLGGLQAYGESEEANLAATFPLDDPAPTVHFPDREFVVTGRFAFGTRARVHDQIQACGGYTHTNVRQSTSFLVIGHFASRDWIHTSYGLKISRADELRREGHSISIVSESHWVKHLPK